MEDELLLDGRECWHISFISVYSENNKIKGIVNRYFQNLPFHAKCLECGALPPLFPLTLGRKIKNPLRPRLYRVNRKS
jgi:hypothetical protein